MFGYFTVAGIFFIILLCLFKFLSFLFTEKNVLIPQ